MSTGSPFVTLPCPTCGQPSRTLERYAGAVCPACEARQVDHEGRGVIAYNVAGFARGVDVAGFDGAVLVHYRERDAEGHEVVAEEATRSHRVWVDDTACVVIEGRFGGTVTMPVETARAAGFRLS